MLPRPAPISAQRPPRGDAQPLQQLDGRRVEAAGEALQAVPLLPVDGRPAYSAMALAGIHGLSPPARDDGARSMPQRAEPQAGAEQTAATPAGLRTEHPARLPSATRLSRALRRIGGRRSSANRWPMSRWTKPWSAEPAHPVPRGPGRRPAWTSRTLPSPAPTTRDVVEQTGGIDFTSGSSRRRTRPRQRGHLAPAITGCSVKTVATDRVDHRVHAPAGELPLTWSFQGPSERDHLVDAGLASRRTLLPCHWIRQRSFQAPSPSRPTASRIPSAAGEHRGLQRRFVPYRELAPRDQ